jgi:predicted ATPase
MTQILLAPLNIEQLILNIIYKRDCSYHFPTNKQNKAFRKISTLSKLKLVLNKTCIQSQSCKVNFVKPIKLNNKHQVKDVTLYDYSDIKSFIVLGHDNFITSEQRKRKKHEKKIVLL